LSVVLLISVYATNHNYITCSYITSMISRDVLSCYAEKNCCQITYFTSHFFLHKYSSSCYEQNNNFDSLLNDHHHNQKNATSKSDVTLLCKTTREFVNKDRLLIIQDQQCCRSLEHLVVPRIVKISICFSVFCSKMLTVYSASDSHAL
jgi:hypothetical protein